MSRLRKLNRLLLAMGLGAFLCASPGFAVVMLEFAESEAERSGEDVFEDSVEEAMGLRESRGESRSRRVATQLSHQDCRLSRFSGRPGRFSAHRTKGHRLANGLNAPLRA
ncbi:MAG: hypothetical protein ACYTGL_07695 [Planctomycetota bacterium]|jgi:hypothetical protein